MLVIRKEQIAAFRVAANERFVERMKRHIAAEHPYHYKRLGEAGAEAVIRKGIADGERYHLGEHDVVGILIELMVELGDGFQRTPDRAWIISILELGDVPGEVKIMAICRRIEATLGARSVIVVPGSRAC